MRPKCDTRGILSSAWSQIRTCEVRGRKKKDQCEGWGRGIGWPQDHRDQHFCSSYYCIHPLCVLFVAVPRPPSTPYHHHIPALLLATGDFPPPHLTVEEIRSSSFRELLDSSWSVGVLFILYHFSKPCAPLPTVIAAIPWSSWSLYVRFLPLKPIFSSHYSTSIPLTGVWSW